MKCFLLSSSAPSFRFSRSTDEKIGLSPASSSSSRRPPSYSTLALPSEERLGFAGTPCSPVMRGIRVVGR